MSVNISEKRSVERSMAWLHILLLALIVFIMGVSITLRVVLFVVASVVLVLVMRPGAPVGRATNSAASE
jgi:membrane protein implicated in regulation of membrane protease activity